MSKLMTLSDVLIEALRVGATKIRYNHDEGKEYDTDYEINSEDLFACVVNSPTNFSKIYLFTKLAWSVVVEPPKPKELYVNEYRDKASVSHSSHELANKHAQSNVIRIGVKYREVLDGE